MNMLELPLLAVRPMIAVLVLPLASVPKIPAIYGTVSDNLEQPSPALSRRSQCEPAAWTRLLRQIRWRLCLAGLPGATTTSR